MYTAISDAAVFYAAESVAAAPDTVVSNTKTTSNNFISKLDTAVLEDAIPEKIVTFRVLSEKVVLEVS